MNPKAIFPSLPNDHPNSQEEIFNAPAKWEQSKLTHSVGYIILNRKSVEFHPGSMSVLGKHIIMPLTEISGVKSGDNFLWRGVVKVELKSEIEGRNCYVFFLGSKRQTFLSFCQKLDIPVA